MQTLEEVVRGVGGSVRQGFRRGGYEYAIELPGNVQAVGFAPLRGEIGAFKRLKKLAKKVKKAAKKVASSKAFKVVKSIAKAAVSVVPGGGAALQGIDAARKVVKAVKAGVKLVKKVKAGVQVARKAVRAGKSVAKNLASQAKKAVQNAPKLAAPGGGKMVKLRSGRTATVLLS